jgi:hypothetical protein
MNQQVGHAEAPIFAANGQARHRVVRAAVVAGIALLAAWLVALALGVLGGFGSLPLLPDSHAKSSNEASSRQSSPAPAPRRANVRAVPAKPATPGSTRSTATRSPSHTSPPRASSPRARSPQTVPSTRTAPSVTSSGHAYGTGTTPPSGKPAGSPGNAPGGSGAPGQLR